MSVTRCDADNIAEAAYSVMTTRGPLAFCGHHYREHAFTLGMLGYPVENLADVRVPAHTLVYGVPGGSQVRLT